MKMQISIILLGMGWILLALFLLSGHYYKKWTENNDRAFISPIAWADHLKLFKGAASCALTSEELLERKAYLKAQIMSKVIRKERQPTAYVLYFEDDPDLLLHLMEFVQKEKACCPFFKFDLSILPFERGIAMQISGSAAAMEMMEEEISDLL